MRLMMILILILCTGPVARAQNTFEKIIDTLGCTTAYCIQETFNGGYVFAGLSNFGGNDLVVVKLDSVGIIDWAKVYSGPGVESGIHIEQTPDSGYIVTALYDGGLNAKCWLLRLDTNGDTLWTETYSSGAGATEIQEMAVSSNGAIYAMAGYYNPLTLTIVNANFIAALSNGLFLVSKVYTISTFGSDARGINKTFDNGFIITGSKGISSLVANAFLIKTDAYGDTVWTRTYTNPSLSIGQSVQQTSDSGFIVAGSIWNSSVFEYNIYLLRTDSIGNTIWTKSYYSTLSQAALSIQQTTDSGYIIAGSNQGRIYLVKTNPVGDTLWARTFGSTLTQNLGYSVKQTKDGGFIVSGFGAIGNKGGAYIIKIDSMGNVLTGLNMPEWNNAMSLTVMPNPSSGNFCVQTRGMPNQACGIEIYNASGQCIFSKSLTLNQTQSIDISEQPNGVYLLLLRTKQEMISKKLLIQK